MKSDAIPANYSVTSPCPTCGSETLHVEFRLRSKPIGTFSVAGAAPKVTVQYWPWLTCSSCDFEEEGKA
jgi:hypothetical protein